MKPYADHLNWNLGIGLNLLVLPAAIWAVWSFLIEPNTAWGSLSLLAVYGVALLLRLAGPVISEIAFYVQAGLNINDEDYIAVSTDARLRERADALRKRAGEILGHDASGMDIEAAAAVVEREDA